MSKKYDFSASINKKITVIHAFTILSVCVLFGIMNTVAGNMIIGASIVAAGVLVTAFVFGFKNKFSLVTLGTIMTQVQLIVIIAMAIAKNELNDMFPLMLASMAMGGVYLDRKNLIIHWCIMSVVSIVGIFLPEMFYGGESLISIVKGIAGINVGGFLIFYLVVFTLKQLVSVKEAEDKAGALLTKVQDQVQKAEAMADEQKNVVEQIATISATVTASSNQMKAIAETIGARAEEQNTAITEIAADITSATTETENSLKESEKASAAAIHSKELLEASYTEIENMLSAMSEIEEKSEQIQGIVKAIEDIAFQTNILALNASVEAARAGEMGKGFAVVADEVRNLANKSQQAVQSTTELIEASQEAVKTGKKIADSVASNMSEVMETAEQSAKHANRINVLTKSQASAISSVKEQMVYITDIVNSTTETAMESMQIASSVSDDAIKMDNIVKNFR